MFECQVLNFYLSKEDSSVFISARIHIVNCHSDTGSKFSYTCSGATAEFLTDSGAAVASSQAPELPAAVTSSGLVPFAVVALRFLLS